MSNEVPLKIANLQVSWFSTRKRGTRKSVARKEAQRNFWKFGEGPHQKLCGLGGTGKRHSFSTEARLGKSVVFLENICSGVKIL